jgi:gliding motility-associated-like protein
MAGFTPSESAPDATLSVTEAGTYEIVWTETDGTCSNDSVIVVSFWALPESEAGADLQICEGSDQVSISGSTSAGGSIAWTSSGGGSFDAADSDNPVYILGADANVITLYKAVTSPFTCGTAMDSMQIFIQQTPVANAGRDGETCGYVYQLSAIPDIGAGNWTTLTGPGTATFSPSPDQPDAMVTVDLPGSYEFIWTEINGPCIDRDTVAVRFIGDLMTDAGPGGSTCGLQFDLRASIPELSTLAADLAGKWSMISGPGQARFSPSDSSAAATAIVDELGEYVFQWEITVGNCTGSDTVAVGFFNQPVANAGPDQVLEFTFNTNLNADIPGVGTGTWSLVKGAGMIESAHDPGTRVSGLGLGQNEFQWTISSEFCPDVSDQVLIVVNDILAPTVITPNGDGQNDFLEFRGIEELSGCELFILDRWGSEVYQSNDYKNNWGGIDQKGRELSPDTYYYILTIPPDRVIKKTLKIIR